MLTTNRLGKVLTKTVATYKFFWFVSILQRCELVCFIPEDDA